LINVRGYDNTALPINMTVFGIYVRAWTDTEERSDGLVIGVLIGMGAAYKYIS